MSHQDVWLVSVSVDFCWVHMSSDSLKTRNGNPISPFCFISVTLVLFEVEEAASAAVGVIFQEVATWVQSWFEDA